MQYFVATRSCHEHRYASHYSVCLSVGSFSLSHSSQNAHAYVNAAFCMSVDPSTHQVLSIANIVYGGIEEHAVSRVSD